MLVRSAGLLARMEPFAGEMVAASLRSAGVQVRTNTGVTRVRRLARATPAEIWTSDADPGQAADLIADELLVAAGRAPRTAGLGVQSARPGAGGRPAADGACQGE